VIPIHGTFDWAFLPNGKVLDDEHHHHEQANEKDKPHRREYSVEYRSQQKQKLSHKNLLVFIFTMATHVIRTVRTSYISAMLTYVTRNITPSLRITLFVLGSTSIALTYTTVFISTATR
jgi:hypothetical protein